MSAAALAGIGGAAFVALALALLWRYRRQAEALGKSRAELKQRARDLAALRRYEAERAQPLDRGAALRARMRARAERGGAAVPDPDDGGD